MAKKQYSGLFFIGDQHLASRVPGFRKDHYPTTALSKLRWCLEYANKNDLVPILLGDLFHWPRDNANWLVGDIIAMIKNPVLAIAGNHDCYENDLGDDDSLMLLVKAGKIQILTEKSPWHGVVNEKNVVIGGASFKESLPTKYDAEGSLVFWVAHHEIRVPGYLDGGNITPYDIPGVDAVINGHIHRQLKPFEKGTTAWLTPGSIVRIRRDDANKAKKPAALRIDVTEKGWETSTIEIPHKPYEEVFYEQVVEENPENDESLFVKGLAELEARRTETGEGIRDFVEDNIKGCSKDVAREIHKLLEEVL
ncbi:MAG: metallophosphoesterase [Waddliaceae bacterium]|jgi:DNA repair exonuclease SbcCD nuclease subunit|nr:metallophosphoesterase [Waddliaceae bacterium]MBT3579404.1 metallophosphoesterase [Waddliaceae bacterium]MBT4444624.1 metallophosphoesterase [Waddliaceae bacterium]MBT6928754.1 metallophosphoesterase [Waddliaceae bacterium]MBT7264222.1 metallophosphoesterase [Waddliaceae bacterium]